MGSSSEGDRNIIGLSDRCQMLELCGKFVGQFPGHK